MPFSLSKKVDSWPKGELQTPSWIPSICWNICIYSFHASQYRSITDFKTLFDSSWKESRALKEPQPSALYNPKPFLWVTSAAEMVLSPRQTTPASRTRALNHQPLLVAVSCSQLWGPPPPTATPTRLQPGFSTCQNVETNLNKTYSRSVSSFDGKRLFSSSS